MADGRCTMLLDSPTFSRPIELRFEPALAGVGLRWLCSDVVVQGRIELDEDMSTYFVQVLGIQLFDGTRLPSREDNATPLLLEAETPTR